MLLTTYLDESGTHDTSPISIMAGYLGTAEQSGAFDAEWIALLRSAGVGHVHAVDLFKRTRAFKGWSAEQANAFAMQLDGVIGPPICSWASRLPSATTTIEQFMREDQSRADHGSIANTACAFGPALPLCHHLSRRNCGSPVKGKAHAK
jgi:hypothetical protein